MLIKNIDEGLNGAYKIYDDQYKLIKNKTFKTICNNINIIDNDNFTCLLDEKKLVNINIQTGELTILYQFKKTIKKIVYYKKNIILTCDYNINNGIKVRQLLKDGQYQIMTILYPSPRQKYNRDANMYLIKNKNILITTNIKESITFWKLNPFKYNHELYIENIEDENLFIDNKQLCSLKDDFFLFILGDYEELRPKTAIKYNFKEKKIAIKKDFDFYINCVEYINKKNIILIGGGGKPGSEISNNIYVLNSDLNQLQRIEINNLYNINGFGFYDKNEKKEYLISLSEDGFLYIYSFY